MHATRRAARAASFTSLTPASKLLLPPATLGETLWTALQGVWRVSVSPTEQASFEAAVQSKVIQDTVLQSASNGSTLTFSLYTHLQNPLWKAHGFCAEEFTKAIGPALTNLHDSLHRLQNQLRAHDFVEARRAMEQAALDAAADQIFAATVGDQGESAPDESTTLSASDDATTTNPPPVAAADNESSSNALAGLPIDRHMVEQLLPPDKQAWLPFLLSSAWRQQTQEAPDSLVAKVSRMTTPSYLAGFYLSSKLGLVMQSGDNPHESAVYEEGSAQVGQVAIVSARVLEMPVRSADEEDDEDDESPTDSEERPTGVAAQIEVLYEVTNRYRERVPVDEKAELQTEHVEYTSLGVAVLEGWLDGGPGDLRWKVPLLREPTEFPLTVSALRTVLTEDEAKDKAA
jgi:hypothetical protein